MKTSKPFATISYNTEAFLKLKLDELCLAHNIEFATFVKHFAEADERKDHIHLYVVPSGQIDTEAFRKVFEELDPLNPLKPLRCLPCKKSKFDDWYLYAVHDKQYLASKGQSRQFHYTFEDLYATDEDFLIEEYHTIDRSRFNGVSRLVEAVEQGKSFEDCVINGMVPLQQFVGYEKAYNAINYGLCRNGRKTHSPTDEVIDMETGEVQFDPQTVIAFETAKKV